MVTNLNTGEEAVDELHATVSGDGSRHAVLLHGLFGMGSNLGALARALAPAYRVHQIDLPNHGRSPWEAHSSLQSLANAVGAYIADCAGAPALLVGHSLGGKVAMQLALQSPQAVSALVVADIAPVSYPASHDAVFAAIAAVAKAQPGSRSAAGEVMQEFVQEEGVRQFLALSLRRDEDRVYRWLFNVQGLRDSYESLRAAPAEGIYRGPTLLISGERSDYVNEAGRDAARRRFTACEFAQLAGAGHWLHAEQPDSFNARVLQFLAAHE